MNWPAIWRTHHQRFAAYAFGFLRSETDVEDLLQDVFMVLVKRDVQADDPVALAMRAIRNRAIDSIRRRARSRRAERAFHAAHCLIDSGNADPLPDDSQVISAIETLSEAQQEVLALRFWCGLQFEQIAAVADMPLGTVASHYSRAMQRLKSKLDPTMEPSRHARTRTD